MVYRSTFACDGCGFQAVVSGDRRWNSTVLYATYHCPQCRHLFDAMLSRYDAKTERWIEFTPRCPADPGHEVHEWQRFSSRDEGPCPTCGGPMRRLALISPGPQPQSPGEWHVGF